MGKSWKQFLTISIWIAIVVFVLRCLLGWSDISQAVNNKSVFTGAYAVFGYGGESIAVTTLIMLIFNKWAWRWKLINICTGKMPILAKKYAGTLTSDYDHIKRDAEIEVDQTFLRVLIKMKTAESSSSTICASIEEIHNEPQLVYTYINEPRADIQDRSGIHYGTVMLKISNPDVITGNYFTGRNTRGVLELKKV